MTPRLDLDRPRSAAEIVGSGVELYVRHWRLFLPMTLAVVAPIDLLLYGVVAGELWSSTKSTPPAAIQALLIIEPAVLTVPLVTAIVVRAVMAIGRGWRPEIRTSLVQGWDDLPAVSWTVLLALLGIGLGFLAFVIPGIYLAVRWAFATQTVVVERVGGPEALRRSGQLVQGGGWWRTFAILLLLGLIAALLSAVISGPLIAWSSVSDLGWVDVLFRIVADTIALPLIALVTTVLFFDLRSRRAAAAAGSTVEGP